jgi:hypothetical protein
MATSAGEWDRLREQLLALERSLAAASAPGRSSQPSSSGSSSGSQPSSQPSPSSSGRSHPTATTPTSSSSSSSHITLLTPAGGAVQLQIPDPDFSARAPPAASPRLAAAGAVRVCTGRKCCAQGALETLAAAQAAAAGSGVEVAPSKCMGKCGKGPCWRARVEGRAGSSLTKGVTAAAAPTLLRQQFGTTC